jgi:hypothetical protein
VLDALRFAPSLFGQICRHGVFSSITLGLETVSSTTATSPVGAYPVQGAILQSVLTLWADWVVVRNPLRDARNGHN